MSSWVLLSQLLHCTALHSLFPRAVQLGDDPLRVTAVHLKNELYDKDDDIVKATSMELVNTMKDLLNMNPLYGEQFKTLMSLTGTTPAAGAAGWSLQAPWRCGPLRLALHHPVTSQPTG
jgi:hypothetical protein